MSVSDTEVQAASARRKRPGRPPTVPLSEFGKAPPPPPPIRLTPRQIVTYASVTLVLVVVIWVGSVWIGQRSDAIWSNAGNVDQRNR